MQGAGPTRREVLVRGAAAGAVVWTLPTLQVIGATAADAASGPAAPPPSPAPVPPEPVPSGALPGHGFAVVDGGAGAFVVKIDSGSLGGLSGLGNSDEEFLRTQRSTVEGRDYRQPTAADLAAFGAAGNGFGATWYTPTGATERIGALFLVLPSGHSVLQGFAFDGSFGAPGKGCGDGDGDGDKYAAATVSGRLVYFTKACDEPAAGEAQER